MTIEECLAFAREREDLPIDNINFWVYKEAYTKAHALLKIIKCYLEPDLYDLLLGNSFLHYYIVTKFNYTKEIVNEDGTITKITIGNDLYDKYSIKDRAFIVSSASDGSSSSSLFTTDAMSKGGFAMQDLIKTPYGEYVYSILEQLNITVVLL